MRRRLPELHQDLLVEVLVWLPVETLVKFRCVSKTWRALIDSNHLRQLHLRRMESWTSKEEQNKLLFVLRPSSTMKKRDLCYLAEFDSRLQKTIFEFRSPFKRDGDWRLDIYGSCNGLVCLGYQDKKYEEEKQKSAFIFLCNPYINKYWELPSYPLPGSHLSHYCMDFYGFGYDDLAHDFKVVRWVQQFSIPNVGEYEDPIPIGEQVMVYSLKSNAWTNLDVQLFPYSKSNQAVAEQNGILVNYALHWMIQDIADRNVAILGLDIRTYKCHRVPLPQGIDRGVDTLLALDGCLCVTNWDGSGGLDLVLKMWIMKDYGVQDSWTEVIIELSSLNTQLPSLGSTTMGERFPFAYSQRSSKLFCYGDNGVKWYDAEKDDLVLAPFVGPHSNGYFWVGFKFVGSLIEPSPCGSNSLVENTGGGMKRVESNLLFRQQQKDTRLQIAR